MKSFAESFFKYFGATVETYDDELIVNLPRDLAQVFDKSRLYLVFPTAQEQTREFSPTEDLLSYGSRTFGQMLGLLAGRGEKTYLYFPDRIATETDDVPLPRQNCRVASCRVHQHQSRFYIINFRSIYVSDEKRESFITVVLDSEGRPTDDLKVMLTEIDVQLIPQMQQPDIEPELLRRVVAEAEEIARQQVSQRAAELEAVIRPRLEKVLLRLIAYYSRMMAEAAGDDPERNKALEFDLRRELDRRIADELERHRLRVRLSPISCAIADVSFAHYRLDLTTDHGTRQTLDLAQNIYTGQILLDVVCHYCREPLDHLALCDRGHLVHSYCLETCHECGRNICQACDLQTCALCKQPVCGDCVAICAYDNRWTCAAHIGSCAICAKPYCPDHAIRCRWCTQIYCVECSPSGECQTCHRALTGSKMSVLPRLPLIEEVKPDRYDWRQAENRIYTVHIGDRFLWRRLIVVTDKAGILIYWQKIGLFERFFGRSGQG